jgi:hypothetical protein
MWRQTKLHPLLFEEMEFCVHGEEELTTSCKQTEGVLGPSVVAGTKVAPFP